MVRGQDVAEAWEDNEPTEMGYVRWGGKRGARPITMQLGYGTRTHLPDYGIRRALFDLAFGYVNGFPPSAITYYVLTRSLNRRIERWAMQREGITFDGDFAVATIDETFSD